MSDEFQSYNAVYAKRMVLVVDDEAINRTLLGNVLQDDYRVIFAQDGKEAYAKIQENADTLSIVLLDLIMPNMHGLELLRMLQSDPALASIPVIVMTSDQSAEVESLRLGAVDFIPKPYPQPEVILARVARTIQLSEGRSIIHFTERDTLTGLYNREYFFRYAQDFDLHHRETSMDAVVMNLNQFHTLNERFGKAYGDEVLRRLAEKAQDVFHAFGGIVCRSESDTFLAYCPHRSDYKAILDQLSVGLAASDLSKSRIRLRMGVYSQVDKSIEMDRRFDRAKMAADHARNNFASSIAYYDNTLHESELYTQQLLEDFQKALTNGEFKVYYQPKYDIHPEIPVLSSAEALVRWEHPTFGMISPAIFIPIFENNGLIPELDLFVWTEAARQIRDWKDRLGRAIPVSVNVSRVDMYDQQLPETLQGILRTYDLAPTDMLLEITESAYTNDADQIIRMVNTLRSLGFFVEMDDFGTGYSSLNMISTLPIDALKLDRQFIHNAFSERRDTRMLEVILDIADYLTVPVIAEGVETLEQLHALKAMGCDIVQGFFFSRPVPAKDFEKLMHEDRDKQSDESALGEQKARYDLSSLDLAREVSYGRIANALSGGFESIYYVDIDNNHYVEYSSQGKYEDLQIQRSGTDFFADTQVNLKRVVYIEDQKRMEAAMNRETILGHLATHDHFAMTYRLMIEGTPTYYSLKAVRTNRKGARQLVVGVSNVDEQVRAAIQADLKRTIIQDDAEIASTDRLSYTRIAQALAQDYFRIYYVNLDTEQFTEMETHGIERTLTVTRVGNGFFEDCKRSIPAHVHPEDREIALHAFERETLFSELSSKPSFTIAYRINLSGNYQYIGLKVMRLPDDASHLIVAMQDMDAQMRHEQEYEVTKAQNVTFSSIAQALAADYFSIYYVDTQTEDFIEYSAHDGYEDLGIEKSGTNFFETSRRNSLRVVYPDDREKLWTMFTKENILGELDRSGTFTMSYRLMLGEKPTYVSLKAMRMEDKADPHIVIGVNSIDTQMRRQEELEKTQQENITYSRIAQALASDYFSIYYVDVVTDQFVEYSSDEHYQQLNIEKGGEYFFETCRKNILRVVYPEDQEKITRAITKDTLLRELDRNGTFNLTYRLVFDGQPTWVSMKATRMQGTDARYIVIGVNNVDAQMQKQLQYEEAMEKSLTYSRIAEALSKDYYSIYYVNIETDEFIEYSSHSDYQELHVEQNGINFFEDCRRNILRLVYPEDKEKALAVWEKDRLIPELQDGKTFSTTYRLMFDEVPVYINCKVIRMNDGNDDPHIVIGVSNVDAQMKRERELTVARDKANKDPLTGVKSKNAYVESEAELNEQIREETAPAFSVVVCDVNGLKQVNDTLGHKAGDRYIQDASTVICNTFKHSPVYRIGGDEFVVLLQGQDHDNRKALLEMLMNNNLTAKQQGGVIIACGQSAYRPGLDQTVAQVFERADERMYENKKALKGNEEIR